MDTEEALKLRKAQVEGKPETDEGPYYHDSWWESYKGSVKGKLGGSIIGAAVGAFVGLGAAAAAISLGSLAVGAAAVMVAGFAAAGMIYGAHEFSDIGKVAGAVAAASEQAESRMKSFEAGKFAELKNDISDLKAAITGKKPADHRSTTDTVAAATDYRTTHCDNHCDFKNKKLVYWKIALIGLAIGAGAGALLAAGAMSAHVLAALGAAEVISKAGLFSASVISMGLFGASFGINRDAFRHVFDKTDLWFKGIFSRNNDGHAPDVALSPAKAAPAPEVTTLVSDNFIAYPSSDTYHRDRVLAAAEKALLNFDHTRATPQ